MEDQFQQITNIIYELAASNPYITKEQIAKARTMYNGDMRSIEEIRAELEAYSEQIRAQGLKSEKGRKLEEQKSKEIEPERVPQFLLNRKNPYNGFYIQEFSVKEVQSTDIVDNNVQREYTDEPEEILEPLRVELPGEEKQSQLQSMIDDALGGSSDNLEDENTYNQGNQQSKEQGKVLVKTQPQEPTPSQSSADDGGYGNVTALLSLTIIFSIVTIIIAFFTIIS